MWDFSSANKHQKNETLLPKEGRQELSHFGLVGWNFSISQLQCTLSRKQGWNITQLQLQTVKIAPEPEEGTQAIPPCLLRLFKKL